MFFRSSNDILELNFIALHIMSSLILETSFLFIIKPRKTTLLEKLDKNWNIRNVRPSKIFPQRKCDNIRLIEFMECSN